jgi:hypothetical protein
MSLHGEYVIWLDCDRLGCTAAVNFGAGTRTDAIEEAKRAGWLIIKEQLVFCPDCKKRREALHV